MRKSKASGRDKRKSLPIKDRDGPQSVVMRAIHEQLVCESYTEECELLCRLNEHQALWRGLHG